ncbi:TRAP transporter substrate-binding protein [Grimontia marina]|uniref:2,3-diketo-L-gulonate-binding periplasmic protein YiaO n=1 Tax=Grimontia marina TaxID=646534 RepID=A0A128EZ15_9GAMM|nr:TRAP transporter substrate-binding protein [Grimontia marina]CZF79370.1 2,3-diketo-L-gulonate-binding periplasmic protein YiaO precursor [Grimontia marina]
MKKTMHFLFVKSGLLAVLLSLTGFDAIAKQMRVSSFEPAKGFFSQTLQAWIDEVNPKLTKGNRFKLYPGSILGAPPAQAELVAKGVADVAFVVPTYTSGLFPMTTVSEIPGLVKDSKTGTRILNTLKQEGLLGTEFADFKVIALFTTPGYRIFSADKQIKVPSDLSGIKMRSPSPYGSELLNEMGASGVPIPAPQVYENMERNVVSSAAWTMDAFKSFRLYEVAPNVTNTRFIATPLAFLMNKKTYERLPDKDKAAIDSMSLSERSAWVAERIDASETDIEAQMKAKPELHFIQLNTEQNAAWTDAFVDARNLWLSGKPDGAEVVLKRAIEIAEE